MNILAPRRRICVTRVTDLDGSIAAREPRREGSEGANRPPLTRFKFVAARQADPTDNALIGRTLVGDDGDQRAALVQQPQQPRRRRLDRGMDQDRVKPGWARVVDERVDPFDPGVFDAKGGQARGRLEGERPAALELDDLA